MRAWREAYDDLPERAPPVTSVMFDMISAHKHKTRRVNDGFHVAMNTVYGYSYGYEHQRVKVGDIPDVPVSARVENGLLIAGSHPVLVDGVAGLLR